MLSLHPQMLVIKSKKPGCLCGAKQRHLLCGQIALMNNDWQRLHVATNPHGEEVRVETLTPEQFTSHLLSRVCCGAFCEGEKLINMLQSYRLSVKVLLSMSITACGL